MICYIVFLIIYSFVGQIHSVLSENVEVSDDDINAAGQTETEPALPTSGGVNFSGLMKASGKVTIVGATEPAFDFPFGIPPIIVGGVYPEEDEVLIFHDYPGPEYLTLDHGIPPFFMPPIDPVHMVPTFAPIPYGGPMFEPNIASMTQPYLIEIIEPIMSPRMSQPQLIEIFDPTMSPMVTQPQLIEIIDPQYGSQPIFDPFHTGFDVPFGGFNPGYSFMPQANVEMIPVLVEIDLPDSVFGHTSVDPEYFIHEAGKTTAKRATQLVPVSGKVTIVGKF